MKFGDETFTVGRFSTSFEVGNFSIEKLFVQAAGQVIVQHEIRGDSHFPIYRTEWDCHDSFGITSDRSMQIRQFKAVLSDSEFVDNGILQRRIEAIRRSHDPEDHGWKWLLESEEELLETPPSVVASFFEDQQIHVWVFVSTELMRSLVLDIEAGRTKNITLEVAWHPILERGHGMDGQRFVLSSFGDLESPKAYGYFRSCTTSGSAAAFVPTGHDELASIQVAGTSATGWSIFKAIGVVFIIVVVAFQSRACW